MSKKWMMGILAAVVLLCSGCKAEDGQSHEEAGKAALQLVTSQTAESDASMEEAFTCTDALGREVVLSGELLAKIRQGQYKAAVLSGSLAEIWTLAGGSLAVVTEDAYEEENRLLAISEDTVSAGSLKHPGMEILASEEVDLVILSAALEGQVSMAETLEQLQIPAIYLSVESFWDYLDALKLLTEITGCQDGYETYGAAVEERVQSQVARQDESQPEILLLRAYSSGVKAKGSDNMTGYMLKELGCVNIADTRQALAEEVSLEAIVLADPEYIFVTTMGSSEEAALESLNSLLADQPAWKSLTAVKEGRYYVLPQNLFHNKPNQRWAESYEILADILYED